MKNKFIPFIVIVLVFIVGCKHEETASNSFRDLLAGLNWGADTCFVYGHKTPDADAVCSSLAYAALMRNLGYNCVAKVSSKTNRETAYISELFGFHLPALKESVSNGTRLILTDHEELAQSVDGADKCVILQIVDHHTVGDLNTSDVGFIFREMVGSTCTLVRLLYEKANVSMHDSVARILLAGILSDTDNLTKDNTTKEDTTAWKSLLSQLHLSEDSVKSIMQKMNEARLDYTGMTDEDIVLSDYKDYAMSGTAVGIGCVDWLDSATMGQFIDRMLVAMPKVMATKNRQMLFCMVSEYVPNPDTATSEQTVIRRGTYILYCGEGAGEVVQKAFGPSLREGVYYSDKRLVRKRDLVPQLTEVLKNRQP